ncbi:MAG: hypothetical protein R6U89_05020 [Dehalococcoidia bacterium]
MSTERRDNSIYCPNEHKCPHDALDCKECGLPIIDYQREVDNLVNRLARKTSYFVPHIIGSFIGVGKRGSQVVADLYQTFGDETPGVSYLNIESIKGQSNMPALPVGQTRFYRYTISETAVGGIIYCGIGERAASKDTHLESYLRMSGIRSDDPGQAIFLAGAVGGGAGSGVGPVLARAVKSLNHRASVLAVATVPSANEADYSHFNAFYGLARLLGVDGDANVDMLLVLDYDRLRHIRGVGRSGEELIADQVITYLLRLFERDLNQSGVIRMSKISKGSKIQVFVPCLAIGRSMEIFGSLTNVLESAGAYPMAQIDYKNVMASYLTLRVPERLEADFPERMVVKEFELWNARHCPSVTSNMVQILPTGEQSDRVDACILLGGDNLSTTIRETVVGYKRFKSSLETPSEWEQCGLSAQSAAEAENMIEQYDRDIQLLRESKTAI